MNVLCVHSVFPPLFAILYTSQQPDGTHFAKRTSKLILVGQIYSQEALRKIHFPFRRLRSRAKRKLVMGCSKTHHALLVPPVSHHANCPCSFGATGEQPRQQARSCSIFRWTHKHKYSPCPCPETEQGSLADQIHRFRDFMISEPDLLHKLYRSVPN